MVIRRHVNTRQEHMEEVIPLVQEIAVCIPEDFSSYVQDMVPLLLASLDWPE